MKIKRIDLGYGCSNTYIIYDEKTFDGVMIDPGGMAEMLLEEAEGINIKYIILTHAHFDHIGALEIVAEKTGAPVVIHQEETMSLTDTRYNLCTFAGVSENMRGADITVKEGDVLKVGDIEFKFIYTPGHTRGGMCIFAGDKDLITGDTLFRGTVGRTDFEGGNHQVLLESVKRLSMLDDSIKIYPGHGEESTIGFEKRTNPYMNI